jgi:hypothetical protein
MRGKQFKQAINVTAKTETKTNQKHHCMKNLIQIHNLLTRSSLAIALAGLALLSNAALAQEKGASVLMRLNQSQAPAVSQPAAPKTGPMSCPKSQDLVKQVPDWSAKGGQILMAGGRPTKSVAQHPCEGCSTKLEVGHAKAK